MEVIFVNERGATFLQWAIMQGVAMILQNRYQRQRLYTRIALGKAKRMDVVWGETAGVDGQLWPFYPILFATKVVFCRILWFSWRFAISQTPSTL
ncbi:uncharacterized protein [Coffea arabica]|uniref:Uncharacterized protein isoform X3 n=1 Tax=Coffea arabica TaxID=13443 RepID=A0A6P6TVG0_COFAR|nr:uncharacterized protein LOC113704290 isoform X4 [Coffea arabica]